MGGRDQARLDVAAAGVNRAVEAAVGPLARELVPRRVNAVSPGVIVTEWWDSLDEHRDEAFQGFTQRTPLGRNGNNPEKEGEECGYS